MTNQVKWLAVDIKIGNLNFNHPTLRDIYNAREKMADEITALFPAKVISVQEKTYEIVVWYIEDK
jgi:hypothetical protein